VNTSGEAIIPYAYGGFANMKFDFVDQGSGFLFDPHCEWNARPLLDISSALSSPGDRKK
jgi:hypothetical protein